MSTRVAIAVVVAIAAGPADADNKSRAAELVAEGSAQFRKNNAGYTNDRYTQMVRTVATEPDPAKRKQQYSALNDFLLDEAFHMPVTQSPGRILAAANVKGIEHRQMDRFILTNTFLA